MLHDLLGSSMPANSVSASLRSVSVSASVRSPDVDTATGDRTEVQETQEYALERVASHEIVWELDPFALSDSFRVSAVLRMFEELGLVARFAIPIKKLRALVVKCLLKLVSLPTIYWLYSYKSTNTDTRHLRRRAAGCKVPRLVSLGQYLLLTNLSCYSLILAAPARL
jgi:hypothetical protein